MLVLSRNRHQNIVIGDRIVVTVVDIRGGKVRLGITAPKELPVHRQEVFEAMQRDMHRGDSRGVTRYRQEKRAEVHRTTDSIDAKRSPWIARIYRLADFSTAACTNATPFPSHMP